nr:killer toxin subunits alpha/beta [Quercus suber]
MEDNCQCTSFVRRPTPIPHGLLNVVGSVFPGFLSYPALRICRFSRGLLVHALRTKPRAVVQLLDSAALDLHFAVPAIVPQVGCCSTSGFCGFGPSFCGSGNCTSSCNAQAECEDDFNQFCLGGTTTDFCGTGCQNGCSPVPEPSCAGVSSQQRRIGYYESWSPSRPCDVWQPETINAFALTHLNYAFALIDQSFHLAQMNSWDTDFYLRFLHLKEQNPKLKLFISIGIIMSQGSKTRNANNAKDADRQGSSADTINFVTFMRELKTAMGSSFGLSVTIPTSYWYMRGFDLKGLERWTDWFNFMAYDIHGTQTSGILSNAEIQRIISAQGLRPTLDSVAGIKVSYDDGDTYKLKANFANQKCLSGTMAWAWILTTLCRRMPLSTLYPPRLHQLSRGFLCMTQQANTPCVVYDADYLGASHGNPPCYGGPLGFSRALCVQNNILANTCSWFGTPASCTGTCPSGYIVVTKNSAPGAFGNVQCDPLSCLPGVLDMILSGGLAPRLENNSNLLLASPNKADGNPACNACYLPGHCGYECLNCACPYYPMSPGGSSTPATTTTTSPSSTTSAPSTLSPRGQPTCDGAVYPEPCQHYSSVIRKSPLLGFLLCPAVAGPVYRGAVARYTRQHYDKGNNGWIKGWTQLPPANNPAGQEDTCDRDEWPPLYFWRTRLGGQWIRLLSTNQNRGVSNSGGSGWADICASGGTLSTTSTGFLLCPAVAGPVYRGAVARYTRQHYDKGNNGWIKGWTQLPPANNPAGQEDTCDRDEWPPLYFWRTRLGGQWIRLLSTNQNRGVSNSGGSGWADICASGGTLSTTSTETERHTPCATHGPSETEHVKWPALSYTFTNMPGYPDDGLTRNFCWPRTLTNDPGFALFTHDSWYTATNNVGAPNYISAAYARPPSGAILAGKQMPTPNQKRDILLIEPEDLVIDEGNSSRKPSEEELWQHFGLLRCKSNECEEEEQALGIPIHRPVDTAIPPRVEAGNSVTRVADPVEEIATEFPALVLASVGGSLQSAYISEPTAA